MSSTAIDAYVREVREVFHIGTMDLADRRSTSLEGDGLSVSLCPAAWTEIARLGGGLDYAVKRRDPAPIMFLDAHAFMEARQEVVRDYAEESGLAVRRPCFIVARHDDEMDAFMLMPVETLEDAFAEMDDGECPVLLSRPEGPLAQNCIYQDTLLVLTPAGERRSRSPRTLDGDEDALIMFAEDCLSVDGIWFDDRYDPAGLSAPRGVVFTKALAEMEIARTICPEDDELSPDAVLKRIATTRPAVHASVSPSHRAAAAESSSPGP